jgi:hypothetical protein
MRKVNSTQANVAGYTGFEQQMCTLKGKVHPITCPGCLIPGNDPVPIVEKAGKVPGLVKTFAENLVLTRISSLQCSSCSEL